MRQTPPAGTSSCRGCVRSSSPRGSAMPGTLWNSCFGSWRRCCSPHGISVGSLREAHGALWFWKARGSSDCPGPRFPGQAVGRGCAVLEAPGGAGRGEGCPAERRRSRGWGDGPTARERRVFVRLHPPRQWISPVAKKKFSPKKKYFWKSAWRKKIFSPRDFWLGRKKSEFPWRSDFFSTISQSPERTAGQAGRYIDSEICVLFWSSRLCQRQAQEDALVAQWTTLKTMLRQFRQEVANSHVHFGCLWFTLPRKTCSMMSSSMRGYLESGLSVSAAGFI